MQLCPVVQTFGLRRPELLPVRTLACPTRTNVAKLLLVLPANILMVLIVQVLILIPPVLLDNIGSHPHQAEPDIVKIRALLIVLLGSIGTAALVLLPLSLWAVVACTLRRQVV